MFDIFLPKNEKKFKASLKNILGIPKAMRRLKSELGIYKLSKILNEPKNAKRRLMRKLGFESKPARALRFFWSILK